MQSMTLKRWGLGLSLLAMSTGLAAQAVTVVLKDGTVMKGDLLGIDSGTLTLQKNGGKSQDISVDDINKVFDADHKVVPLGAAADDSVQPAAQPAASDEPADDVVPKRRGKRHLRESAATEGSANSHHNGLQGRKVAGEVIFWSGTAVTIIGLGAMLYGNSQESSATSTYCKTGLCSGQDYSPYTIDGYPGYYTYSQYTQYYYGQAWVDGGAVVGCVGLACMLTGLLITPSARAMENASLLNYNDHQLSLGVPSVGINRFGGPRASLLSATF